MAFLRIFTVGLAGLAVWGCSSIVQGTSQDIVINTNPNNATCTLQREGDEIAKVDNTPTTINVQKSKHDLTITCSKDGFQTTTFLNPSGWEIRTGIAGAALDVAFTLGLSSAIDSVTGADNKYTSPVNLTLVPTPTLSLVAVP